MSKEREFAAFLAAQMTLMQAAKEISALCKHLSSTATQIELLGVASTLQTISFGLREVAKIRGEDEQ